MNDQEKVYKFIRAAVEKLQEKGDYIDEEKLVQLIQDTYKKGGPEAVKDMFAEIFKDEQKMFKDGGKMESAVNLFKCGGKSKSKSSKKVRKGQEGLEFYGQNYIKRPGGGYFVYGTDLSNPNYSSDDKYMMIDLGSDGDNIGIKISGNDTIPFIAPKTKYTHNEGKVVNNPSLNKAIINAVEKENKSYGNQDPLLGYKYSGTDIYGRTVLVPGQENTYVRDHDNNIETISTRNGKVSKVVDNGRPIYYGDKMGEYGLINQDSLRNVFETLLKSNKTYPYSHSYRYFYNIHRKDNKK